jgi:hypothetical protein
MAEKPTSDVLKARAEAAELLGFGNNPDRLCASDRLKVDLVSTLRLVIDHAGAVALEGGTADIGRLVGAVEQLTKLLPKTAEPVSTRSDPRAALLEMILQMRERDGVPDVITLQETIDEQAAEIEQLRAEVAALKAGGAGKPVDDDVPEVVERVPAPAPAANVVPLPRAPAPAAKTSPSYDYDASNEWKAFVNSDGSIRSTPRGSGHDWGPV